MSTVDEVQEDRERRTIYIVVGAVLAVLLVIALISFSSGKSSQQADQKATQLIAALKAAGAPAPSKDAVVRVLGDDGGALCDDPAGGLRKGILLSQIVNGAAGPGLRPVVADRRIVQGQLLVLKIYCPDKLPTFQELVNDLKLDETVNG
jgi:Tfp pilus assembly protein FimT